MVLPHNELALWIDNNKVHVPKGITVAAALCYSQVEYCRMSVTQHQRAPFCGMGICQECRITINGERRLACQTLCENEMRIERL